MYDGRAADVWSVGICVYAITRGFFPFSVKQLHRISKYRAYGFELAGEDGRAPFPHDDEAPGVPVINLVD